MNEYFSLSDITPGKSAVITELSTAEGIRRRLYDLGIIEGTKIKCLFRSPLCDPTAYLIRGAVIALRREDTKNIAVIPLN